MSRLLLVPFILCSVNDNKIEQETFPRHFCVIILLYSIVVQFMQLYSTVQHFLGPEYYFLNRQFFNGVYVQSSISSRISYVSVYTNF